MTVPSTARRGGLADVARSRPEWKPWLDVLDAVTEAAGDRAWRPAVPDVPLTMDTDVPVLAGATLTPDARLVRRWTRRLLDTAAQAGGAATALAEVARASDAEVAELLESGLAHDVQRMSALAVRHGVEPEALAAVASVAPTPLLRACAERWRERLPIAGWRHGYCPVCGAWPALAEARGLERERRLRCGRCAADWSFPWLRCAYCGMDDHTQLGGLVAEDGSQVTIDTCGACRGYLKSVTTLGATPADQVALVDLATVELDVAALEQGYHRPPAPGAALGARIELRAGGRLGAWRR